MKRRQVWLWMLVISVLVVEAQVDFAQSTPLEPKQPEKQTTPAKLFDRPTVSADEVTDSVIGPELKGIIIVKSVAEVNRQGAPITSGIVVHDIPLLSEPDFQSSIASFIGKKITTKTVKQLQQEIILYCRHKNRPVVDLLMPEQVLDSGVLQLVFIEGKLGKVTIQHEGKTQWFSNQLILSDVHVTPGASIDSQQLLADLDWLNRNPFREVDAMFKQGEKAGETDLALTLRDRFPVRVYAGYQDTGTKYTGESELVSGLNWGNAFGFDHQLGYQYTTDLAFNRLQAHSASYQIPLPWQHMVTFSGSYVEVNPELPSAFTSRGTTETLGMRYAIPLTSIEKFKHELTFGFDYKETDNNFLFGGTSVIHSKPVILQLQAGYSGTLPDSFGQTSFSGEFYFSPGDVMGNNNSSEFSALRTNANAQYFYGRLSGERLTRLPWDFSWIARAQGQFASERLLPSEQLGLGGNATVRGYEEHQANGDNGWYVSNELRTPPVSIGKLLGQGRLADQLQFLAFFDYGEVNTKSPVTELSNAELMSFGSGVRYTINPYLSVRCDYGWQLKKPDTRIAVPGQSSSRMHLAAVVSF